ncbi:MAG: SDR family NAD(P)-dependent oxidoreductase [Clostridia bacterium]|nr:SDR family NAD(P)-dependent oxidoreductase [Clostridia bacterium]
MNWLKEQTVVVSGASSGIGKELTKLFIQKANAHVIGIARNEQKMKDFVAELGESASHFSYELFDVSKEENWKNFAEKLTVQNITPALVVNNAGIMPPFNNFLNISLEEGKKVMDTNFYSVVYATHYLLPLLSQNGGVANIASSDALLSVGGTNYYAASKGAVRAFSQALRYEFPTKYIACVFPGFTDTNIFRDIKMSDKDKRRINRIISPTNKIAKKIYRALVRRKKYKVVGWDAHAFSMLSRLMPSGGARLVNGVLKKAKVDMFSSVEKQG